MAKTKAKTKIAQTRHKARAAHADPERWNRILIIGGVVVVILVVVGIIAYGWYDTEIKPLSKTVLRVGDTTFSLAHLERRMELEKDSLSPENYAQLPDILMAQLEREAVLLNGAPQLNITVTDEDVTAEIRDRGNLAEDAASNVFAAEFRRQVDESGLREGEYRHMLRADLVENQVRNYFRYLAPTEEPQVRARWIVLEDEEKAQAALRRLEAGEDFAVVAQDASLDTSTSASGGELGWAPRGASVFVPDDVEAFLFEAEPGERSEVINVVNLYYIAELLERDDNRALEDEQRQRVAEREMNKWLADVMETLDVARDLTTEDAIRALDDIL